MTFASPGVTGTTSDPFAIVETGTACNGPCTLDAEFLGSGDTTTTTTNVSTNLTGSLSIQFFGQNLPSAITDGGGCDNFIERATSGQFNGKAAAAVVINVQGSLTGDTFIDYGIPDKLLKGKYGTNYGQPNVPICVGVQRLGDDPTTPVVEANAHIPCDHDSIPRGRRTLDRQGARARWQAHRELQARGVRPDDAPVVEHRADLPGSTDSKWIPAARRDRDLGLDECDCL